MKSYIYCFLIVLLTTVLQHYGHCALTYPDHITDEEKDEILNDGILKRVKRFDASHPCSNNLVITNPNRRVSKTLGVGDVAISDTYLQPAWYRFKGPAGGEMPTYAPEVNSCGTKWPIWLKGSPPTEQGVIAYMKACIHHAHQECFREWEMQTVNCGTYHAYRLNNPPMSDSAYCAGLETLCPEGTNSNNGFTPGCTANFPALDGRVKLRVSHKEESMVFDCDYQGRVPGDTRLEVEWYVEGDKDTNPYRPAWTDILVERKRSQLTRGRWTNRLGSTVYCKVSASWRSEQGAPSKPIFSKKHFAGIKVLNESLTVSEALEAGEIGIQSTIPIICMPEYESVCKIVVELEYDASNEEHQQVVFGDCSVEITPQNWNQVHKIRVKAVRDFYEDGRKEKTIRFKKIYTTVASDIWNDYQIPDIKVYSSNGKTGLCTSHGDPHMLTFDRLLYHAYREGEYVLYESTKFPIKVHARMQKCATATCNCAVAVAVQDDVIVVDRCTRVPRNHASGSSFPHGWNTIHAHVLEQGGNFAKGLNVYEHDDGRKYTIHLPTGAYIQFEVMEQWVNIYIHASSDDFNATKGLCGTFDGVKGNDFRLADDSHLTPSEGESCGRHTSTCDFISSWKVTDRNSLFQSKVDLRWHESQILREESFCLCTKVDGLDTVTCDYQNDVFNSEALYEQRHGKVVTDKVKLRSEGKDSLSNRRTRRSVDATQDENLNDFADDYFQSNFVHNDSFKGELVELKPKRDAERLCVNAFNSAYISTYIQQLEDSEKNALLQSCVIDVQMTNSEEWIEMSLKQVVARSTDNMMKNKIHIDKRMLVGVCPQACSNHGRCTNRTCHCNAGWAGIYCGVDLSMSPSSVRLANDGLCDNEVSQCDNIKIFGKGFKANDNITCLFKHLSALNSVSVQEEYEMRGKFMNFEQILVPLPFLPKDMDVFVVELSVNGHFNFTDLNNYVVFSSKCMRCQVPNSEAVCQAKNNTCHIDNVCYTEGEAGEEDCCKVCDPSFSSSQFKNRAWPADLSVSELSRSIGIQSPDDITFFNPPVPFTCPTTNVRISGMSTCREVDAYLRGEEGIEIAFSCKVKHQITCSFEVKVEDACSSAVRIYNITIDFKGRHQLIKDECEDKPTDRDKVEMWYVKEDSLQTYQVQAFHPLHSSTFNVQLPWNTRETVEYISISDTGLISYNVPAYEQMLPNITVVLTHQCGNTERLLIKFFDELE